MRRFFLAPLAAADLDSILEYVLTEGGPEAAQRVANAFERAFGKLAHRPGIGHRRDDLTKRAVLFWPLWSYLIVYDPDSQPLRIVRILHGARDLISLLK